MKKTLVIITGPTASGKSESAISVARKFGGEIISADSMQVYRQMDIGTAKINLKNTSDIPHHLIDILEPSEEFSVAEFSILAKNKIDEIHSRGSLPFLVGGTTLYVQAIVDNIQFFDIPINDQIRNELRDYATENGNEAVWELLNQVDPTLAQSLHFNNLGRIIRGIESYRVSGKPLSYWQKKSTETPSPYNILLVGIIPKSREELYRKIDDRVDSMIEYGLIDEIKGLYKADCSRTAKQAIGYKELWDYISGTSSLESCVDKLKMETRRYAKRQLTWIRNREGLITVYNDDNMMENICRLIEKTIDGGCL